MNSATAVCFLVLQLAIVSSNFAAASSHRQATRFAPMTALAVNDAQLKTIKDHVSKSNKKDVYLGMCTEEEYEEWYANEYPLECQEQMSNASSLFVLFGVYCDPFCGGLYFEYLDECGGTGMLLSSFYTHLCVENENGVPCYYYITSEEHYNSRPEVEEYCFPMNDTCSSECFFALEAMVVEMGCCINTLYNQSIPDPVAQYALWESCDLTAPDYCASDEFSGSLCLGNSLNILSIALVLLGGVIFK